MENRVKGRAATRSAYCGAGGRRVRIRVDLLRRLIEHVDRLEPELEKARELLAEGDQQLIYWWESQHSCPCGARPESPTTHPHVLMCPTERALSAVLEGRK